MEIKTKYNVGDKVYFLSNNAVVCLPIDTIRIEIDKNNNIIKYRISNNGTCEWRQEDKLFTTKEELLKSL